MLDIQLRNLLDQARAADVPDMADVPPPVARQIYSGLCTAADVARADVAIEDKVIPGPGGPLALRVYRPRGGVSARGRVLYLHGGGFMVGCPRDYDGVCSALSEMSDCVLVQVDYRLAPEHPFPAAVDDAYAALGCLADHGGEIGADPARIIVAGDSAGANLATVTALLARDRGGPPLRQQTLLYPVTSPRPEMFDSYARHGQGYTLTTRQTHYFSRHYLGSPEAAADFRVAPLLAEDLSNLPPALVILAAYDPLRDEGAAYADKLAEAGTQVTLVEYMGLAHGFITMGGALQAARLAAAQLAMGWRQILAA
jgi:acetyl esterase